MKREANIPCCHVAALPYPGRGHINPMMAFCKLLVSKQPDIRISFIVTEEWHGFIGSDDSIPGNISLATVPNVIPSEIGRSKINLEFMNAVCTERSKLQKPVKLLLDRLQPKIRVLIADSFLSWAVEAANERSIPLASFWPSSGSLIVMVDHVDLLKQNGHFPADVSVLGDQVIDYIPGITPTRLSDLPDKFSGDGLNSIHIFRDAVNNLPKAQYLLLNSFYELEPLAFDQLRAKLTSTTFYPIGPSIPYLELPKPTHNDLENPHYLNWLDSQPDKSVLYISFGSFLSVSKVAGMDKIVRGVRKSGVRFLWVAREDDDECYGELMKQGCVGDLHNGGEGLVVPWCDQLRVMCHSAVGAFWTHCGWSSMLEGVYGGLTFLALPIAGDQAPHGKKLVEDWKVGLRVRREDEVAELVRRIMDGESDEGKEMRERARRLHEACRRAIDDDGASSSNVVAFIEDVISRG